MGRGDAGRDTPGRPVAGRHARWAVLILAWWVVMAVACVAQAGVAQAGPSPTLAAVRARGAVACGIAGTVAGFSLPDAQGVMRGLDADWCRAVAAAVFGDARRVTYVPTTVQNRFTALQSGEVDLLVRQTTWTLAREAGLGLLAAGVNFYDGTAFLVRRGSGVTRADQLDGATVCMQPGSSTELMVADWFRQHGRTFHPLLIEDVTEVRAAVLAGRCDAYATDGSALATFRATQGAHADDYTVLPDRISREPLGAMVRQGDDGWFNIVRWSLFAQILAEEEGLTSADVAAARAGSTAPDVRRLLGVEGDLGAALGLRASWAYDIIREVGSYAEMWDRDIAPLGLARGLNALWTKGGLMYAPPLR